MALIQQPENPNMLAKTKFKFVLQRAPNVVFWSQSTALPSLSLSTANQVTPFTNIPRPGGKTTFEDYSLTFKVDEDLRNYLEVFEWLYNLGFVGDMGGYGRIEQSGQKTVSDATLMILTNKDNGNISATFRDMYPVSISRLEFDTTATDITYMDVTVDFKYQSFSVERILNRP